MTLREERDSAGEAEDDLLAATGGRELIFTDMVTAVSETKAAQRVEPRPA